MIARRLTVYISLSIRLDIIGHYRKRAMSLTPRTKYHNVILGDMHTYMHRRRAHAGDTARGRGIEQRDTKEEFPASALSVSLEKPLSQWQRWSLLTWAFQVAVALLSRSATGSPVRALRPRFLREREKKISQNRRGNRNKGLKVAAAGKRCRAKPRVLVIRADSRIADLPFDDRDLSFANRSSAGPAYPPLHVNAVGKIKRRTIVDNSPIAFNFNWEPASP